MNGPAVRRDCRSHYPLLIEGYASLFGVTDQSGDQVRAGAFANSLKTRAAAMLLHHRPGAEIGRWVRLQEDGRGLFVRGLIESPTAQSLIKAGLNGLSIGFRPQVWTARRQGGRTLIKVDLIEISLVARPMLQQARIHPIETTDK